MRRITPLAVLLTLAIGCDETTQPDLTPLPQPNLGVVSVSVSDVTTIDDLALSNASNPRVSGNGLGTALAVWQQFTGSEVRIFSNQYSGDWSSASVIEAGTHNAQVPVVVANRDGSAMAAWHELDGTRNKISANRYLGGWVGEVDIDDPIAGNANSLFPEIAGNGDGAVIAVWRQFVATRNVIFANWFSAGWDGAVAIDDPTQSDAQFPVVSVDGLGTATVVWQQVVDGTIGILANRISLGTTPPTPVRIDGGLSHSVEPAVSASTNGRVVAVWKHFTGSTSVIMSNVHDGQWGSPERIDDQSLLHSANPAVVASTDGSAIAAWQQFDGSRLVVVANRFDGVSWGNPTGISVPLPGNSQNVDLAADDRGNVVAVWQGFDGATDRIYANWFDGEWRDAFLVSEDPALGHARLPRVAFDAPGSAVVVWQGFTGSRLAVRSATISGLTAEEQLELLLDEVLANPDLNGGQVNSLTSKLENIIKQIDKGNVGPAINMLEAFVNQVEALINSGHLSAEGGQPLIDMAQAVIDELSGS